MASAIASASIRSFLFDLTKGFTNCAGTMQGVCPNDLAFLASQWQPGQASIPIVVWGKRARYSINLTRVKHRLIRI